MRTENTETNLFIAHFWGTKGKWRVFCLWRNNARYANHQHHQTFTVDKLRLWRDHFTFSHFPLGRLKEQLLKLETSCAVLNHMGLDSDYRITTRCEITVIILLLPVYRLIRTQFCMNRYSLGWKLTLYGSLEVRICQHLTAVKRISI